MATFTVMWIIEELFLFARGLTRPIFRSCVKCGRQYSIFTSYKPFNKYEKCYISYPSNSRSQNYQKSIDFLGVFLNSDITSLHKIFEDLMLRFSTILQWSVYPNQKTLFSSHIKGEKNPKPPKKKTPAKSQNTYSKLREVFFKVFFSSI